MQVGSFVKLQVTTDDRLDNRQQHMYLVRGCHGNETSANAADTNCCFALTVLKNIAKIIHSLEMREAQMP